MISSSMKETKYAQALFDLVMKNECLDEVIHDFETFVGAINNNLAWLNLMDSPMIKRKQKYKMIEELSDFHPIFLNFLKVLIKNRAITSYESIYERWRVLAWEEQRIAHVRIVTAKPLTVQQLNIIREELWGWIEDKEIDMEIIIDKRLLGGIRIFYQGQTIDRSLRAQLKELNSTL